MDFLKGQPNPISVYSDPVIGTVRNKMFSQYENHLRDSNINREFSGFSISETLALD